MTDKILETKRPLVLTIDDDDLLRETFCMFLEYQGYHVVEAENGRVGLEVFEREKPDIVLVDLNMPEVTGLEVLAKVVADSPDTPVIVISGTDLIGEAVEALRLGAWEYLIKPLGDLMILCHAVEKALERARLIRENRANRIALEQRALELAQTLETLKATQRDLIQAGKMAALGQLVTGVSHEINTPVGVSITAASFLNRKTREAKSEFSAGTLQRSGLEKYFQTAEESASIILSNLEIAANLIQHFKQVAVDRLPEEKRKFDVREYIDDVFSGLRAVFKDAEYAVTVNCPKGLTLYSYPDAFMHILSNLVENSIFHGFEKKGKGNIVVDVGKKDNDLLIHYRDDGKGMTPEQLEKIFEPFFTTGRSSGRVGLGMHIVYNLVVQTLKGHIECRSELGGGAEFVIRIPGISPINIE